MILLRVFLPSTQLPPETTVKAGEVELCAAARTIVESELGDVCEPGWLVRKSERARRKREERLYDAILR